MAHVFRCALVGCDDLKVSKPRGTNLQRRLHDLDPSLMEACIGHGAIDSLVAGDVTGDAAGRPAGRLVRSARACVIDRPAASAWGRDRERGFGGGHLGARAPVTLRRIARAGDTGGDAWGRQVYRGSGRVGSAGVASVEGRFAGPVMCSAVQGAKASRTADHHTRLNCKSTDKNRVSGTGYFRSLQ
jgi:hypothetical protein